MCGPTRPELPLRDDAAVLVGGGLPVLALPKSVAVNELSRQQVWQVQAHVRVQQPQEQQQHNRKQQQHAACGGGSDADSRSSSPRAHGHGPRGTPACSVAQQHLFSTCWQQQHGARQGQHRSAGPSPLVSPRSACSTPGGADNSIGIQLHALVFEPSRCAQQQRRQHGADAGNGAFPGPGGGAGRAPLLGAGGRHHGYPQRTRTSQDLRRASSTEASGNPWGAARGGGAMLQTIAALGMRDGPGSGAWAGRGSISKAKQVLAEAISSMPGSHGMRDFAPAACDTGVLAPLLSIVRNNGAPASRRASFSEGASVASLGSSSGSACSGSSACGFSSGSRCLASASGQLLGGGGVRCGAAARLARCSSAGDSDDLPAAVPPTLPEDGEPPELGAASHAEELAAARARARAAQLQKVADCIDTIKMLSVDDSNRLALVDLGAVELLLSKLQPAARPEPQVAVACLGALAALCRHDALKQQLWDSADSGAILALLGSRRASPEVRAAHQAVAQLGWSVDSAPEQRGAGGGGCLNSGSVFDSVSSHISSAESTSSSCSGANVLLEPALVSALAAGLHPAADVPVLLSALRLLSRAASSADYELPAPPLTPDAAAATQAGRPARPGWHRVLFSVMPLLIPTRRRQGHLVISAALELLIVLTERHPELHAAVAVAGCLPPLLAQVLEGSSEQSLQAACILTGLVDTPAAQERLSQEPALAVLLRVLGDRGKSVDVRLAAVHMLRRLSASVPRCVRVLTANFAVPVVLALAREVPDNDVRRAAAGLLQLLGRPVVLRVRQPRRSVDGGGCRTPHQQERHAAYP